jgi:hypothetical protein
MLTTRCQGCRDMAFTAEGDHPACFVLVRLTWRQRRGQLPWPVTELLPLPLTERIMFE